MKKTTEFVLGLAGGIIGVIAGFIAMYYHSFNNWLVVGSIVLSIIGIAGSIVVSSRQVLAGVLMTIAAIGGTICITTYYILPGLLLIIAGLMELFKKRNKANISTAH